MTYQPKVSSTGISNYVMTAKNAAFSKPPYQMQPKVSSQSGFLQHNASAKNLKPQKFNMTLKSPVNLHQMSQFTQNSSVLNQTEQDSTNQSRLQPCFSQDAQNFYQKVQNCKVVQSSLKEVRSQEREVPMSVERKKSKISKNLKLSKQQPSYKPTPSTTKASQKTQILLENKGIDLTRTIDNINRSIEKVKSSLQTFSQTRKKRSDSRSSQNGTNTAATSSYKQFIRQKLTENADSQTKTVRTKPQHAYTNSGAGAAVGYSSLQKFNTIDALSH